MLRQSMENIQIKSCKVCGEEVTERWINAQYETLNFLGVKKKFIVEPGRWESELTNGFCKSCFERETKRNEKEKAEKELQEKNSKAIEIIGGRYAFENFNFDSYSPKTKSQEIALKTCREFDFNFENLMLVGPAGVGKSHLACSILKNSGDCIFNSQRWRVTELLRRIREFNDNAKQQSIEIEKVVYSKILVIEDIGVEKDTVWGSSILWEILDKRIENGINGLILTSNLGRSKLAENMTDRIPSRISHLCKFVQIDGPDNRLIKNA